MKKDKSTVTISIKILWVLVILANIKSIFTDSGFDNTYTVSMAYRHINGDGMFINMWEPHQTSMFLTEILMRIYRIFVPSYTGVIIFLQIFGTLFFALLCIPLYKLIKKYSGKIIAELACIFFMAFRVKQSSFPDYANMLILFSVLLFISLVNYINEHKLTDLILVSLFMCLQVLSYPSSVITGIGVIIILIIYSDRKFLSVLVFSLSCALAGAVYTGFFIIKLGADRFITSVKNIFLTDSHSSTSEMYSSYFQGIPVAILWLAISVFLAISVTLIINYSKTITGSRLIKIKMCFHGSTFSTVLGIVIAVVEVIMLLLQKKLGYESSCVIYLIPLTLTILAIPGFLRMESEAQRVWLISLIISVSSFISAQLLTDLGLITVLAFLSLAGTVSFIPLSHMKEDLTGFLVGICLCIVLHRGLVIWGFGNKWNVNMVYEVENIVRSGPSAGTVCDYMTYYMTEADYRDHHNYIHDDDTFMLVETWVFDPAEYMLSPGSIANPSTIDTPVYNEHTLDYFKLNPDKTPSVIAVSCWYGNLNIDKDSFIMKWIDENYYIEADGSYWRYYRKALE